MLPIISLRGTNGVALGFRVEQEVTPSFVRSLEVARFLLNVWGDMFNIGEVNDFREESQPTILI